MGLYEMLIPILWTILFISIGALVFITLLKILTALKGD
jgi:tryptophan-rich sensory protein